MAYLGAGAPTELKEQRRVVIATSSRVAKPARRNAGAARKHGNAP